MASLASKVRNDTANPDDDPRFFFFTFSRTIIRNRNAEHGEAQYNAQSYGRLLASAMGDSLGLLLRSPFLSYLSKKNEHSADW